MDPFPSEGDPESGPDIAALREAITSGDPARAMPALAGLRVLSSRAATPPGACATDMPQLQPLPEPTP